MRANFNLVDLQLLVYIAEEQSLTRAAERASLSLPAASMRIKQFEESVGAKLLFRNKHGVTLTPTGDTVLKHARIVLNQLEALRGDLHEHVEGFRGHIRMVANATSVNATLPLLLRQYLTSYPNIDISLSEKLSNEAAKSVADGTADLAIIAENTSADGLHLIPYRREKLVLVTSSNHALAGRELVDFEETLAYEYVSLHESSAICIFLKKHAHSLNNSLNIRIQTASFDAVCRMVETDIGVSVLPISVAQRYAKIMDLHITLLRDAWSTRQSWICVRNLEALPVFVRRLVEMLHGSESASDAHYPSNDAGHA